MKVGKVHVNCLCVLLCGVMQGVLQANGQTYSDVYQLKNDVLTNYSSTIIPLKNQSDIMQVYVTFDIVSIVNVDEVQQMIVINGFVGLIWVDEIIAWNPADYNGVSELFFDPNEIWKPRVVLLNTLDERDPFSDDYNPFMAVSSGAAMWIPGGIFQASCGLNLEKFPYDEHVCELTFFSLRGSYQRLRFTTNGTNETVGQTFFVPNGEWELVSASVQIREAASESDLTERQPSFSISFKLRRYPTFYMINVFMPVMMLSLLDIFVFLIPVESGERIGYSVTVLLSFTMYMTIVTTFLPTTSEHMPMMNSYLFLQLVMAVSAVIVTQIIVWFHHKEEEKEKKQKVRSTAGRVFKKLRLFGIFNSSKPTQESDDDDSESVPKAKSASNNFDFTTASQKHQANSTAFGTDREYQFPFDVLRSEDQEVTTKVKDVQRERSQKGSHIFRGLKKGQVHPSPQVTSSEETGKVGKVNRYKLIGNYINQCCFVLFTLYNVIITTCFMVAIIT